MVEERDSERAGEGWHTNCVDEQAATEGGWGSTYQGFVSRSENTTQGRPTKK